MKRTNFKRNKLGFMMSELLLVVAIVVILVMLGVTGFVALRRNIVITKYDDLAREIYVAAQNQLIRLEANGMDKDTEDTLAAGEPLPSKPTDSDYNDEDWGSVAASYHYAQKNAEQNDTLIMDVLLPLGAVADDVRSNGFYVIEYNAETYMVYSVFYSEEKEGIDYSAVSADEEFRSKKSVRKNYMVGYYGGSAVERDPMTHCAEPELEIINNNRLQLNILNSGSYEISVKVSDGAGHDADATSLIKDDGNKKTVILDSIYKDEKHFKDLFPNLIPGDDLTITVTYSNSEAGLISSSASVTANSLFAARDGNTVTVAYARHLQNLEKTVSGVDDSITAARQTEHIEWEKDNFNIGIDENDNDISNDGLFVSIDNPNLISYDGSYLEIRYLEGKNGLFEKTTANMQLSNIRIVNPVIEADDSKSIPVGALAGETVNGTKIEMCGVYCNEITADGKVDYAAYEKYYVKGGSATTGGLVGQATGTTVEYSFAALPLLEGGNGAALIGSASGCTIENSYANCDNLKPGFNYFVSGGDSADINTITHSYAVGNVAAKTTDTNGAFSNTNDTVTDCYYAVSHCIFAANWEDNQNLDAAQFCYKGETGDWQELTQNQLQEAVETAFLTTGWTNTIAPLSHPYRKYLDGRAFPYPAIAHNTLGVLDHYGSWPDGNGTVDLKITMSLLNNEDVYAISAGRVIVTDKVTGDILFDSDAHKKADGSFDGEDTIQVPPQTDVIIKIQAENGYTYVKTVVKEEVLPDSKADNEWTVEYKVENDTEAVITFQQKAFKLTGIPAVNENGGDIVDAIYNIDLEKPQKTLTIKNSEQSEEKVETGSTVTVRTSLPGDNYVGSVVWYETNGADTYLTQNADGNYTFEMPAGETKVHVKYTTKSADFKIKYYVMDTEGSYPPDGNPTYETDYKCGLGSPINQDMIDAMTESSRLTVTIDGEDVLYFKKSVVTSANKGEIFNSNLGEDGSITSSGSYVTKEEDGTYTVKIYIDRKQYNVILKTGDHVTGVKFDGDNKFAAPTVTKEKIFYGAEVIAMAQVEPGYSFTYWLPQTSKFMMSSDTNYKFKMPAFDLVLTANAANDRYLVTINLLKDDESWLFSDPLRQADPITLTLVNSNDPDDRYTMDVLTEDTISYAMQAVVPVISKYGAGYYVEVTYESAPTEPIYIYTSAGRENDNSQNEKLLLNVREKALVEDVHFYSVTYHPNRENYIGSAPKAGAYPMYYHLKIEGNTGLLRAPNDVEFFRGWKDYDAAAGTSLYNGTDEYITVTRRIDMFAQWEGYKGNVVYHAGEADGGEPPVDDNTYYRNYSQFTVLKGSLARNGYEFIGWSTSKDSTSVEYYVDSTRQFNPGADNKLHLYPVWKAETYTVQFFDAAGEHLTNYDDSAPFGEEINVPGLTVDDNDIVGWALEKGGDVVCRPGEKYTVTGNTALYARTAAEYVTVTYMDYNGNAPSLYTEEIGKGTSFYLNYVPDDGAVTAWSTAPYGKGELFVCDENGRSEKPATFTEDTILYAVTGKVYNYNKQEWFNTLGDAVADEDTVDGNTLIVYRDTDEPVRIEINKSIYVIAHGNRTVKWIDDAKNGSGELLKEEKSSDNKDDASKEFVGCMYVYNAGNAVTVHFGESEVSGLSMEGSTLTFDANKQSRVIAIGNSATFHMYDGVTLTRGYRTGGTGYDGGTKAFRTGYGGGVYAGAGAVFHMHGGTVSHCEAVSGGGVYLITGSRMYMGEMVHPDNYSATATYYRIEPDDSLNEDIYINASGVTQENYKQFYVTAGNPQICYNHASQVWDGTYGNGGGGLLMLNLNNGDLILYCGSITNNTTTANGGAIVTDSANNNCFLRIYEVDISHNKADGNAGGIFQWHGTVYVYNSTIRQNKAEKNGGGIYLNDGGEVYDIQFYFGDISDNEATENGGGVYVENGGTFYLRGGNLCRNKAQDGGGTYLDGSSSSLIFEKGMLSDNKATNNGGGVYSNAIINMSGGTLSGNRAENNGGGIYTEGTMTMTEGTICNNKARYLGGGVMMQGGKFTLSGGSLYGSTDTDYPNGYADEDSVHPGPNDIYLSRNCVITIPNGGIELSGEERVYVDCENDNSMRDEHRQQAPYRWTFPSYLYRFAEYDNSNDIEAEDELYFSYYGSRSSPNSRMTDLTVKYSDYYNNGRWGETNLRGLWFYVPEYNTDTSSSSSVTIDLNYPEKPAPQTEVHEVGDKINMSRVIAAAARSGYYLAGWARTPYALEEDYELFYDVVEDAWKSGYKENGVWTPAADNDGIIYYTVEDLASQTLYAQWRPYVVVYNLGELVTNESHIQSTSVGPHVTILSPSPMEFTKDSKTYYLAGWIGNDGKTYNPMDQVDLEGILRLTADWKEKPKETYTITFHFNDGTSDKTGELLRVVAVDDEKYTIDFDVHRANKILDYWSTEEDGTGIEKYIKGDTVPNVVKNIDLYAIWADAVTLTYDVNGGKENNKVNSVRTGEYDTIINFVPTRDGYTFVGWAETEDATEAKYKYQGTAPFQGNIGPLSQNTTLYAVWKEN